ncbi:agamous-like MADS-box protein AGL80 [Olea europaea var. sylvestris]|uniref:agamous-like MADS-box protein AGL80 n=1 Tax=Olea europaea var. sylvestris TaxID=158386 RepID=UPI000C1D48ED|nr:agamous-like MADS-box protein AGL80 [Olea europaea var. sylvestris]
MTRGKIKLEYIANDAERRASFRKRKKGIPTVWPSRLDAQQIISRFREFPEVEQTQRLFNQESYTIQRVQKSRKQAEKLQRINRITDMEILMHQCMACLSSLQNVPLSDITEMGRLAEQNIQDIKTRMKELEKNWATNLQMVSENSLIPDKTKEKKFYAFSNDRYRKNLRLKKNSETTMTTIKLMNQDLIRLDRFDDTNFTQWQDKLKLLLTALKISYILDPD